jgi:beta-carotene 3-hydroxylase
MLLNAALLLAAFLAMELLAYATHRYVMHGWMWCWHRSHHEPRTGVFERNDLFAILFAAPAILLIYLGVHHVAPALWVGLGITLYGVFYALVHDGMVHRRFGRWFYTPRSGYLRRLLQAHRLHHAVRTRAGCVSFGFLYAPPPRALKLALRHTARRP